MQRESIASNPGAEGAAPATAPRRPLKSRDKRWARALADWLARHGAKPNAISFCSVVFAAAAGAALYAIGHKAGVERVVCLLAAVGGIQLRLLCNLLDGMVAVEGGRKTATGEIWNDFPDRVADLLILVSAGYGIGSGWAIAVAWTAGTLAVLTAYVRILAGSARAQQRFLGPMAKQHRMGLMSAACIVSLAEPLFAPRGTVLLAALAVVALGSLITVIRRLHRLAQDLENDLRER